MSRKLQRNGSLPRATGPPLSALIKEQHKLHKIKPFFPDLASRQMKTKLFQQKIRPQGRLYGRLCRTRILCSTLNDYPGRIATCPLSSCSNKNDGPRGRFNCISTVSCKGSVFAEVLTNFYGRFFVEEGQLIKYTPSTPSLHLGSHFFHLLTPPRFGALNLPEVN